MQICCSVYINRYYISRFVHFLLHLRPMTAEQLKAMRDRLHVLGGFL